MIVITNIEIFRKTKFSVFLIYADWYTHVKKKWYIHLSSWLQNEHSRLFIILHLYIKYNWMHSCVGVLYE